MQFEMRIPNMCRLSLHELPLLSDGHFSEKVYDGVSAKTCKNVQNQFWYIAETMRSRGLRQARQMISSTNSVNAEIFREIGRAHRMDLAVSGGFTHLSNFCATTISGALSMSI